MTGQELGPGNQPQGGEKAREQQALRALLADVCTRAQIPVTVTDIEVFELILTGHNVAETIRLTGLSAEEVRQSRQVWSRACALATRRLETGGSPSGRLLT